MHGRILWQFREFVESRDGKRAWKAALKSAGLEDRVYLAQAYPDAEAVLLLQAVVKMSGKSASVLLQDFGEFTVPALLGMYAHLIRPEWRALDVIEHAERVAHGAVRKHERGAAPPYLLVRRVNRHKVMLTYSSPRKMCAFAVGVGLGLGKYFQESVSVQHNPCMYQGADHCEITYTVV
jgi:hypothetical protein